MAWTLAANLRARRDMVLAVYPKMAIGSIGDQSHQVETSDHNPDARGIVHAIDIMTETDADFDGAAAHILAWLLSETDDLQYMIHDRRIYGRDEANGWHGSPYTGSDPHTNHIHVSGRHGSTGKNSATGTGYDTTAEAYVPATSLADYMEATMPFSQADADLVAKTVIGRALSNGATVNNALVTLMLRVPTDLVAFEAKVTPSAIGAAVVAALPPSVAGGLTAEQVGHAVHAELVAQAQAAAGAPEVSTP